jgi:hypothetical protein
MVFTKSEQAIKTKFEVGTCPNNQPIRAVGPCIIGSVVIVATATIGCVFPCERSQNVLGANGSTSIDWSQNALGAGGLNIRGRSMNALGADGSAIRG